ncbi:DEAD-box ATP-dependent RNA helicase 16 [Micractinium conductrix]|uniref:RNA helicase n=1 Tax=Micractinium conductrix TaxID=554055 RepID=A0A2P6VJW0_9CHLO|nr:DEAD-box ATP-dependent RNA helicase 16 [Micractinium conductrix]|eukprot:PSC74391.1 DEAD-box ATP-dependent RNA helicase 16 [Micractinium conductrix]
MSFDATGLDPRLLRALAKRGFDKPTPVQAECIPKALEGRDIVARARTGSGKTLAYLLPALHRVLAGGKGRAGWQALVLVPTRELCEQVKEEASSVAAACGADLAVTAIAGDAPLRAACATAGQLVVTTPAKLAQALREGILTPRMLQDRLQVLVLDEADLLLSYGYEEDVAALAPQVPRSCQCMLMSATSSAEVDRLTALVLHNPLTLNLLGQATGEAGAATAAAAAGGAAAEIEHFRVDLPAGCSASGAAAETAEKLLHLLALLKLNLVQRKVLVFVNTAESGMRVRLFLEAFGVRSAVLNAELPLNSRHHILQEFNKGLFDYLIATDDVHAPAVDGDDEQQQRKRKKGGGGGGGKKKGPRKDEEFGVTRGIDFKGVGTVVNFELPGSTQGYVHRVGRTGRAGEAGAAVTLLAPADAAFAAELDQMLAERGGDQQQQQQQQQQPPAGAAQSDDDASGSDSDDEAAPGGGKAGKRGGGGSGGLRTHDRLTKAAVEALRYRAEDVARSITRNVIKEARAKELKNELLNSQRLAAFFEEHPADLNLLKHDKPLAAAGAAAAAAHLKHLPSYLRDPNLQGKTFASGSGRGALPMRKRRRMEGLDPVKGFLRAPRKGGEANEEETDLEKKAADWGKKHRSKGQKRKGAAEARPKQNVRKGKGRKR